MNINTGWREASILKPVGKRYLSVLAGAIISAGAAAQPFPVNERGDVR